MQIARRRNARAAASWVSVEAALWVEKTERENSYYRCIIIGVVKVSSGEYNVWRLNGVMLVCSCSSAIDENVRGAKEFKSENDVELSSSSQPPKISTTP